MIPSGKILRSVAIVTLLAVTACSQAVDPKAEVTAAGASEDAGGGGFDVDAYQRELVACYEDHGVDARANPDGSVSSDTQGTLGRQKSLELNATCEQRLVEAGIIDLSPPTVEDLKRVHAGLGELRVCLTEAGFQLPELPSAESFVSDPSLLEHPMQTVSDEYGPDGLARALEACDGVGRP